MDKDRQKGRDRDTQKWAKREICIYTYIHMNKDLDRKIVRKKNNKLDRKKNKKNLYLDTHKEGEKDKQKDRKR